MTLRPRAALFALLMLAVASQATTATAAAPAMAPEIASDAPVLVIVKVPSPWYAPQFLIRSRMRDTIPQYERRPGLAFKAYAFARADGAFGGIYLWRDLASARAWFDPAWFERVERERGAHADVRFFEVVGAIDTVPGGTRIDPESPAVATLAATDPREGRPAAPALAAALDADRRTPGLLRRYRVLDAKGRQAVLSLWRDEDAARQNPDANAAAEWFDTPILLPSALPGNRPTVPGL